MEPTWVSDFSALAQVIFVDLVLAGDNAIVVGLVAASLPAEKRPRVILLGIAAAAVMRLMFAVIAVQLLSIIGLLLAGGLLLLWVCWKLWRELREQTRAPAEPTQPETPASKKTTRQAVYQIMLADVSMSLDNVLAVAGIARHNTWILVFGLALSVAFMGFAAAWIAKLLTRHPWIAYVGLVTILYVALTMIWEGAHQVLDAAAAYQESLG